MLLELGPVQVVMAVSSQSTVKIFFFLVWLVVFCVTVIITFIAWASVVQVLCYGYDALVLGLANCSGRGLADHDAKSISSSDLLSTQNWADLIIDMRIRLMHYPNHPFVCHISSNQVIVSLQPRILYSQSS